jgi:hypothetical protein
LAAKVVRQDLIAADYLGVAGTPAVLLDDLLFKGSPGFAYLQRYVEARRSEAR